MYVRYTNLVPKSYIRTWHRLATYLLPIVGVAAWMKQTSSVIVLNITCQHKYAGPLMLLLIHTVHMLWIMTTFFWLKDVNGVLTIDGMLKDWVWTLLKDTLSHRRHIINQNFEIISSRFERITYFCVVGELSLLKIAYVCYDEETYFRYRIARKHWRHVSLVLAVVNMTLKRRQYRRRLNNHPSREGEHF